MTGHVIPSQRPVVLLEDCGCCGADHRPEFSGDCRDDKARYHVPAICGCVVCRECEEDCLRERGYCTECLYTTEGAP